MAKNLRSQSVEPVESAQEVTPEVVADKMNVATFCVIREHSLGIKARLVNHLFYSDADHDKTLEEWDAIYTEIMSRKS